MDREAIEEYATEIEKVTDEILGNLSLLLGMDKDGLRLLHAEMRQAMRVNYYPTCSRPDLVLGVSPHSDGGSITVLIQDDEIAGLQIKHKGEWVPVKPIPNALVVNIGDVIEVHDAVNQAHVQSEYSLLTIPYFISEICRYGAMGCTGVLNTEQ